jgi:alkylhydroperoxidase family enzyme
MSLVQANFTALSLPAPLREAVILRIGAHHASAYEIRHHRLIAAAAGLGDAGIESLLALQSPSDEFNPIVRDAILLTDTLVRGSPVDDVRIQRLVSALGHRGYVELAMLIGFYRMVATFIEATGLEPESDEQLTRWHAAGGR